MSKKKESLGNLYSMLSLITVRDPAASLAPNSSRTIILPEKMLSKVMVGWNPDSWVGLRGTTASLPWKCSLNKRRRFGLFVQYLLISFCAVSSSYLKHIWLTLTQKAAVQHVSVCVFQSRKSQGETRQTVPGFSHQFTNIVEKFTD